MNNFRWVINLIKLNASSNYQAGFEKGTFFSLGPRPEDYRAEVGRFPFRRPSPTSGNPILDCTLILILLAGEIPLKANSPRIPWGACRHGNSFVGTSFKDLSKGASEIWSSQPQRLDRTSYVLAHRKRDFLWESDTDRSLGL